MEKRKYTKEFQIEALNLAKELGNYSAAAKQLGISDSVLYVWRDKFIFSIDKANIKTAAE
ncbi:MAG: transposase [Proteobacteria bacterium]|jgi:transposase-like protein|nr:transposase [Pseudomonadota bacterium]